MKIKSLKKVLLGTSAFLLSGAMAFSVVLPSLQFGGASSQSVTAEAGSVTDITGMVNQDSLKDLMDRSVVQKLPDTVEPEQELSVILTLDTDTMLDEYDASATDKSLADYAASDAGKAVAARIAQESSLLRNRMRNAGLSFTLGDEYDTLIGGFEVIIRASQFGALCNAVEGHAAVMVGEQYAECETKVVENDVNIDKTTGIFSSEGSGYDGRGTLIAVLDTGLDYTHPAFDPDNFIADESYDVIKPDELAAVVPSLRAAQSSPGLTAANVYLNRKVPYAYDYADKDDEVSPINSPHGTHVAGVMVGKDSEITGVAPNAQLAVMKVFSEGSTGAKQSWILSALEDCAILGVHVINMSLGTACGFSREEDTDQRNAIYQRLQERGVIVVAAASNDFNSTYGSEKNGNLPLTTNPDSATVGAPSTYPSSLSVASISGVKTPYLLYNGTIIYFTEATDRAAEPKNFVDEILEEGQETAEFTYVVIHGAGRAGDYQGVDVAGKIALVERGQTNFEEKANIAKQNGAVGCIIYNNVSGDIAMNVGNVGDWPVCSVSKDDGALLVRAGNEGKITISRNQTAGPFMSDFSSWGPGPDLSIKPEITAHGGDIYSSIPGNRYDRMSGTSMAAPNQAGVTALVRQYVQEKFPRYTPVQVANTVYQIMMSTADIALNTNGLPFSVRKQGAGLANLIHATTTPAYLQTFDRTTDTVMDKAKIELGDDANKTGVYNLKFNIVNITDKELTYDADAFVETEGVSETYTYKGATTVTQKGYELDGAEVEVTGVTGDGSHSGKTITVRGNATVTVTMSITLGAADKEYLDRSFANGMYVEGFVTLTAKNGTDINLNLPYLAYYGDWGAAPLFDLDYFETNKDELDDSKETLEKTLPDAYATRPLGGLYDDYIVALGSFAYLQDPNSTNKVSAEREHIALTNQDGQYGGISSIRSVNLGLLRNAKTMKVTITDSVTGEVIYTQTEYNLSKSYNYGSAIIGHSMDINFNVRDYDLRNNTKYLVKLEGTIDYGDGHVTNNTFEFPFYTDFTAPLVTGVEYTYEYDRDAEKNRLFANISVYDNHYVQLCVPGYIYSSSDGYRLGTFSRYPSAVQGSRNTTSVVRIELTDYLNDIKTKSYDGRSFVVNAVDYALNSSMFELVLPDDIVTVDFPDAEKELKISPNQVYKLNPITFPEQDEAWKESLVYTSGSESVVRVVNGKLIGIAPGTATVQVSTAAGEFKNSIKVTVLSEKDKGYRKYDPPTVDSFTLTGYLVNKVFLFVNSSDCDLGTSSAGSSVKFSGAYSLRMFPSESVTLQYEIERYFDDDRYRVEYISGNDRIASVDSSGTIVARNVDENGNPLNSERSTTISVRLQMWNETRQAWETKLTRSVYVTVKESYVTNGPYLMSYMGLGGVVSIPEEFGITEIQQFAFSNYDLVPKDLSAGDVIDKEDPYYSKQWYIGDNTIQEVIIPEGVETIGMYAFANLTALTRITLPSTLTKIQMGAFVGCNKLSEIKFSSDNNLQFINQDAFEGCSALVNVDLRSIIAIGDAAFRNSGLVSVQFPASAQSIGAHAFEDCARLSRATIAAQKVKIGAGAFAGCAKLTSMTINASVLPAEVFESCSSLTSLKIGKDVEVIGQFALLNTGITSFEVDKDNAYFNAGKDGKYLVGKDGTLAIVSPDVTDFNPDDASIVKIGVGAFSSSANLASVTLPRVTEVEDYAFSGCTLLRKVSLGKLTKVGTEAFYVAPLSALPEFADGAEIGNRAFIGTSVRQVEIPDGATVGDSAFAANSNLLSVKLGDNVTVGDSSFYGCRSLSSVEIGDNAVLGFGSFAAANFSNYVRSSFVSTNTTYRFAGRNYNVYIDPYISALSHLVIGDNAQIGDYAFRGAGSYYYTNGATVMGGYLRSAEIGAGATIGDYAFFNCQYLADIDLSQVTSIGEFAFSGGLVEYFDYMGTYVSFGYIYPATAMSSIDLSSLGLSRDGEEIASPLGMGAFAYMPNLKEITFGEQLKSIPQEAFLGTGLTSVDLSQFDSVGAAAFADGKLETVTLKEGATIGADAFNGNSSLATVNGLDTVRVIGATAFAGTALKQADISSAVEVGDFAFANTPVTTATLRDLVSVGENPFSGCALQPFTRTGENGKTSDTFDVGDSIKVIEGVLYRVCPNGLVLVCYPAAKQDKTFKTARNTVRVGANAFLGAPLISVEFNRELKAIGDRALYGCLNLTAVTFTSIEAPLLEEAYIEEYEYTYTDDGLEYYIWDSVGMYGDGSSNNSLNVLGFRAWDFSPTTVLFGANFVARIGDREGRATLAEKTLVMVRPINGTGYEHFIFGQYFDVTLNGVTAATDTTQEVIDRIDALPSAIDLTLDDEAEVVAIRALYESLAEDQKGLVTNLSVLTNAELVIGNLKDNSQPTPPSGGDDNQDGDETVPYLWVYIVIAVAVAAALVATAVVLLFKKNKQANAAEDASAQPQDENSDEENSENE